MIKKAFKWIVFLFLTLLIIAGAFASHEWYADKPVFLRSLLDRSMIKVAFESPETLTSLGFLESVGIKNHNANLDNDSPEKADELFALMKQVKTGIKNFPNEELNKADKLSKEIALYLLDFGDELERFRYHNYPVNQLFGIQNGYPSFMDAQHQVNTVEDAENYISRLSKVKTKFKQNLQGLKIRENKGIIPPAFVIDRVLKEMTTFVAQPIEDNILYSSLKSKMEKAQEISAQEQSRILADVKIQMKKSVHPAYQILIDYFIALKPKANTDDGFWRLPQGEEAYASSLKFFTTTDYTPDEIHEMGLAEVVRIQSEILTILSEQNIATEQGFTQAIETLKEREEFYYPDTTAGRDQILADYQTILDEINAGLDLAFRIRPKAGMKVRRIPEFKEKTAPGAYYQQPSIDGSRPGMFFANLYDIKATPKYSMRTLAYHEGIPGHHFQIAIAMELEGMPLFRRMSPFTAYTEGWALYAEYLAWELGFESDPFDNIGRLQAELFRAVRLVVDTGLHHKRWTREESIQYMLANTGMALTDVTSEIERYIVMPGQATSYKVGMMKILALREKAKKALGKQFTLRDFHDVVLKNGAVPLNILERLVNQYIERLQKIAKS
ncbi:DUF885 domain-containing protein [Pseudoalteromonas denitrificans]|uniref:Uncharacterized conserved protein, DUF885 familyt n=1 Tax=Pseudoalteromonas denitrificans DSM 6059 TaxID=1123010 RepID=A0A1I1Q6J3_9GAMM|nr:DUF885 domain-containing protein [Pseudoalteromonas denitrificans]SFD14843.1 Uncharacterized conserved protein, DUF885 familyt [Pseudoalteromonas denitrificans DSM 6059]